MVTCRKVAETKPTPAICDNLSRDRGLVTGGPKRTLSQSFDKHSKLRTLKAGRRMSRSPQPTCAPHAALYAWGWLPRPAAPDEPA